MEAYIAATNIVDSMNDIPEEIISQEGDIVGDLDGGAAQEESCELSDADIVANFIDQQGARHYISHSLSRPDVSGYMLWELT